MLDTTLMLVEHIHIGFLDFCKKRESFWYKGQVALG